MAARTFPMQHNTHFHNGTMEYNNSTGSDQDSSSGDVSPLKQHLRPNIITSQGHQFPRLPPMNPLIPPQIVSKNGIELPFPVMSQGMYPIPNHGNAPHVWFPLPPCSNYLPGRPIPPPETSQASMDPSQSHAPPPPSIIPIMSNHPTHPLPLAPPANCITWQIVDESGVLRQVVYGPSSPQIHPNNFPPSKQPIPPPATSLPTTSVVSLPQTNDIKLHIPKTYVGPSVHSSSPNQAGLLVMNPGAVESNPCSSAQAARDTVTSKTPLQRALSNVSAPSLTDVTRDSVVIKLVDSPDADFLEFGVDPSSLCYQLLIREQTSAKPSDDLPPDENDLHGFSVLYEGREQEVIVHDLSVNTFYAVCLRCGIKSDDSSFIWGEPSPIVVQKTCPGVPWTPGPPKMTSRNRNSLSLKWSVPSSDGGATVSVYQLQYQELDNTRTTKDDAWVTATEANAYQFRVTKLKPGTAYAARLACKNSVGWSAYSSIAVCSTLEAAPTPPEPPHLTCPPTPDTLSLAWEKRAADYNFMIEFHDFQAGSGSTRIVYNNHDPFFTMSKLRRASRYQFRLKTSTAEGVESMWSPPALFETCPSAPSPPCNLKIKGKPGTHAFIVCWESPHDTGGSAIVKYDVDVEPCNELLSVPANQALQVVCSGKKPGTMYKVRVTAYTQCGECSKPSDPLTVTTAAQSPSECPAPTCEPVPAGKQPPPDRLSLVWDAPETDGGSPITAFHVIDLAVPESKPPQKPDKLLHDSPVRHFTWTGLTHGRSYHVCVRAVNSVGPGVWSPVTTLTTGPAPPDAPPTIRATTLTCYSVRLNWLVPECNGSAITGYSVQYCKHDDENTCPDEASFGVCESVKASTSPNIVEVDGLLCDSVYWFRVAAINVKGGGPFSPATHSRTYKSPPLAPTDVQTDSLSPSSFSVTWQSPDSFGAPISCYNLNIVSVESGEVLDHSVGGDCSNFCVNGLAAKSTYKVRVCAVSELGVGAWSEFVTCSTHPGLPPPPSLSFHSSDSGTTWCKVKVCHPNPACKVVITPTPPATQVWSVFISGGSQTIKLKNLKPGQEYLLTAHAINQAGKSESSNVTVRTKALPGPQAKAPIASEVTCNSVKLSWKGDDQLCGGSVVVQISSVSDVKWTQVYSGSATSCVVDQSSVLLPGVSYVARLKAVSPENSVWSHHCAFRTLDPAVTDKLDTSTLAAESAPVASFASKANAVSAKDGGKRVSVVGRLSQQLSKLSDQQLTILIIAGFGIICAIFAVLFIT